MNKKQIAVIWLGIIIALIVGTCFFPVTSSRVVFGPEKKYVTEEYLAVVPIWSDRFKPEIRVEVLGGQRYDKNSEQLKVHTPLLITQLAFIGISTIGLCIAYKDKKE